jgi:hypothetical protein
LITTTTWLPANASSSGMTFSNGNLTVTCQSVGAGKMGYTASPASTNKKVYWEITATNSALLLGIALSTANLSNSLSNQASAGISYSYYINNGFIYDGVSNRKASGLSTTGTKFGFALDTTAGAMKIQFYSNGVAQGSPISLADGSYYPAFGFQSNNSTGLTANFGSSAFNYTPPTGFTSFNSNL